MAGLFDMTVEHGGVGAKPELVGLAMNANPGAGVGLVLANLVTNFGMEDFGSSSGQAAQAGFFEFRKDVSRRPSGHPGKPVPFHGRVRFQVQTRVSLVDDS